MTRITRQGHKLGADDLRVSASAALRAHTIEGAVSLGREDDLGSLEPGKYADFAVLGGDPLTAAPRTSRRSPSSRPGSDGRAFAHARRLTKGRPMTAEQYADTAGRAIMDHPRDTA